MRMFNCSILKRL